MRSRSGKELPPILASRSVGGAMSPHSIVIQESSGRKPTVWGACWRQCRHFADGQLGPRRLRPAVCQPLTESRTSNIRLRRMSVEVRWHEQQVRQLPLQLRRSLTWDRGNEIADYRNFMQNFEQLGVAIRAGARMLRCAEFSDSSNSGEAASRS